MSALGQWLVDIGRERFAEAFEREQVTFENLPDRTESDLKDLGLPRGPRKTFLAAAATLRAGRKTSPPQLPEGEEGKELAASKPEPQGERRQLTVMFCDLVGSTALSEKLDPEELRSLLHNYRTVCGEVIARYDGFVARYVGDGILTYFGWPTAHEDDAERSIRTV